MEPVAPMQALLTTLALVPSSLMTIAGNVVTFVMAEGHELALVSFGTILAYSGIKVIKSII